MSSILSKKKNPTGDGTEMDLAVIQLPAPAEDKNPSSMDFVAEYPDAQGYIGGKRAGCL